MPSLSDYHAPYPEAAPGQERKVIYLPALDARLEQEHTRVQLIPGRHEDCEDGRLYHLTGTISEGTVEGWGYNYYTVTLGDIYAAHRSPADPENASTFVAMYENPIIRYNSKLPIVVYVPAGAELRYRVWMDEAGRVAQANGTAAAAAAPTNEELDEPRSRDVKVQEYAQEAPRQQRSYPEPAASRGIPQTAEYEQEAAQHTHSTEAYEENYAENRPLRSVEAGGHRGIPALTQEEEMHREEQPQERGYVEETNAAPALRASEKAEQPEREAEALPEEHQGHRKGDPNSERRRRSSSKPRKHSASEGEAPRTQRPRGLSATEASPGESEKAPKSASERSPSSRNEKRGSVDKSNNASATSPRRSSVSSNKDKDKDGTYEKKAKNFWNRARGSSNSKTSTPKKKSGKGDQWSEM